MAQKKLCKLVKKELPRENPQKWAELISPGNYFCSRCGLTAREKDQICRPKKIK